MPNGEVLEIFICAAKGDPMVSVKEVLAIEGRGLEGDRYAAGQGQYQTRRNHVTFIAVEAIAAANGELPMSEAIFRRETRRNIVVIGVPLNDFAGREFSIGEARFRGVKPCPPCPRPPTLMGRDPAQAVSFVTAFENRGGLTVEVLSTGLIRVGDPIIHD